MTSVTDSTDQTTPADESGEVWTTRTLFARHKAAGIIAVALVVLLLATIVGGILAQSSLVVSDSSSCSVWSSANQTQQTAYARRYVQQHGALPNGATDPRSVVNAINAGCTQAFDNDTQDNATVVNAVKQ